MGTYVWYSGMADYPLEKRKRIKENILKMLDAGGMMQIESVKNNNHELYVLSKPEKDQNNRILWNYNYFEDDMWETASLDCKDLQIYSNKVGNEEYKDVMIALYMLSELEDNDIGFTMCNGDIVSEEKYVGWINQILGTNYSFRKRFNLWENVEWYIENEKCEEMHISMKELFELIPKNLRYAAGGTELADLLWVINGTSSLLPRDLDPDSYAYEVWKCQRAIQEIFIKDLENEEEKILSLLQMPRNRRKSVMDPIMKKLAKFTLFLPARIVLFLYTEFTGDNFWEIWSAIKSGAYHDEKMKKYASKELELYRKIFIEGQNCSSYNIGFFKPRWILYILGDAFRTCWRRKLLYIRLEPAILVGKNRRCRNHGRDRYMVKHAGERIRNDIERQRTRDRKCICGPYI